MGFCPLTRTEGQQTHQDHTSDKHSERVNILSGPLLKAQKDFPERTERKRTTRETLLSLTWQEYWKIFSKNCIPLHFKLRNSQKQKLKTQNWFLFYLDWNLRKYPLFFQGMVSSLQLRFKTYWILTVNLKMNWTFSPTWMQHLEHIGFPLLTWQHGMVLCDLYKSDRQRPAVQSIPVNESWTHIMLLSQEWVHTHTNTPTVWHNSHCLAVLLLHKNLLPHETIRHCVMMHD